MAFYPAFVPGSAQGITPPFNLQGTGSGTLFGAGTIGDTFPRVELDADGSVRWSSGAGASDARIFRNGAGLLNVGAGVTLSTPFLNVTSGGLDVTTAGKGVAVAEGANAKQGIATLVAGTVTVANTNVTASSRILVTCQILGTVTTASTFDTPRTAGTSFTIHASQATDTSTVAWEIFEPG